MKLAIFTDIWGIDPTLASWANSLPCADQLELLSPYPQGCDTELPHFSDDQHAYSFFTQHGGLDQYTTFARDWMAQQTDPVMVLGFSAGGAVAYQLACDDRHPKAIFGVYAGQIHRLAQRLVQCPTQLVFSDEHHFDVPTLVASLGQQALINAEHWRYPHGFANTRSQGFTAQALLKLTAQVHCWLKSQ